MPLEFTALGADGAEQKINFNDLIQQMQANGERVVGHSPDGQQIQIEDSKGTFSVSPQQVLSQLGWQVQGVQPLSPDYSQVSPRARAAITAISGEDNKIAYLQMLERRNGNPNPQIMGSGRDFFVFDPKTQNYRALTNNPDWDVSDLGEAAAELPGAIGATIGAGLGAAGGSAAGGIGAVPGLMAGAAAGSALGNSITKVALGIQDEDARKAMLDSPWTQAGGVAGTAAFDAATAGVGAKIPGAVSAMTRGAGRVVSGVGRVMGHGARLLDNNFGRDVVGTMVNPAGNTLAVAELAGKAPAGLMKAANRLPGYVGEQMAKVPGYLERKGLMAELSPETQTSMKNWMMKKAGDLQNYTKRLQLKTDLPTNIRGEAFKTAENAGAWLGGRKPSSTVTLEDEMANLGEYLGGGKEARGVYQVAEEGGLSPNDARIYARNELGKEWGKVGAKAGRLAETLDAAGDMAGSINRGIGAGVIKGTRAAGIGANVVGDGMQYTGMMMSPLENRLATRYGSEEANRYLKRRKGWQMPTVQSKINPVEIASEE